MKTTKITGKIVRRIVLLSCFLIILFGIRTTATVISVGSDGDFYSISEAVAAAEDGDEIIVSEGIYDETTETFPIETDKSIYLHAAEGQSVTIKSPITKIALKLKGTGSTLENINFDFVRSAALHVLGDDITINGCNFDMTEMEWLETSCGMWVGGAKNMTLRNSEFHHCSIAIAGPPVVEEKKDIPVLTALFEVGEDLSFFTTHHIENTKVNGKPLEYVVGLKDKTYTSDCGQLIAINCENIEFNNLDVSGGSIGFELAYSNNCSINDTIANDCGIFGIYLAKCNDILMKNITANNGGHGVDLRDCDRCIVEDCVADDCGQGIFFSWGRDCKAVRCEMLNDGTGFFSASGENNVVEDCTIGSNELGLYVQHEPFVMTGTIVKENTSCGLRVTDCRPVVKGNTFTDNFVASLILNCPVSEFSGNVFAGSENSVLYYKNCQEISISENDFTGETVEPIQLVDSEEPVIK